LRLKTFEHLQNLSLRFYSKSRTGELISRTINDSMMIERAVSAVLGDLVKEPFVMVGLIGYLIWLDPKLSVGALVLFPICIVPVVLFGRRVRKHARHGQERLASIVSIMQEALVGMRIVKAFGMESYEVERFASECRVLFHRIMRVVAARASIEPIIVFVSIAGLSLVLLYAKWVEMPVENFLTFAIAMMMLYDPAKKLSRIHLHIQQTSAAADRIFELLDTPVLIEDSPRASDFKGPVESVAFDNVSFAYDEAPVLQAINVTVKAGERMAIVGGSGMGKTTLVNLVPRFYDVTGGRVLLNGTDVRDFTLKSLRRQIGIVTQETILFNDTVANNIAYGHADALRETIEEAARRANAHDFIVKLPKGYDSVIGERGAMLSLGQCQRIAIARAILRNPPILILDEATSALDTESERLVQAALNDLMHGRTVLAIAHRLSTIINCDKIVVVDKGQIVESGTHSELLAMNGIYRRLYDMQFDSAPPR
jgi:subfamily B ATP-binding cassette protein MsbA